MAIECKRRFTEVNLMFLIQMSLFNCDWFSEPRNTRLFIITKHNECERPSRKRFKIVMSILQSLKLFCNKMEILNPHKKR